MRIAVYAGVSTALAATVVVSAFHQRANFYSAMVYLSQSNLCLLILINLIFLVYGSFMYGLQRICFGQLRPIEIEQLYEKAWFAVTETCLVMTIFREEVGAFFLVMFTVLVTGKVWGWIGDGRLEVLEQQPPPNPRLFHTRMSISLVLSILYDFWLLHYAVWTVIDQARPNMMVMFLFEFAILAVCSVHTGLRYIVSLVDARIIKKQTQQRLEDRRRQIREQRSEILRRREAEGTTGEDDEALPSEDDIDEMDIEVPGWEAKGQWVLSLNLFSDFLKLSIYAAFFFVLLRFYGLPIHIMRDLFMTTRSFVKRLGALLKYRQALRDMEKYPDATDVELERENTCIICREDMHQWDPNNPGQVERSRPKKLPCGHILHFGCLKSWLERQQVCPTCRRSVVVNDAHVARNNRDAMMFRVGLNLPAGQNQQGQVNGAANGGQNVQQGAPQPPQQPQQQAARNGVRMFNLGPLRLGFAQGDVDDLPNMAQQLGLPVNVANGVATPPTPNHQQQAAPGATSSEALRSQLRDIELRIQQEIQALDHTQLELQTLHLLVGELGRLRQLAQAQQMVNSVVQNNSNASASTPQVPAAPRFPMGQQPLPAFHAPSQQYFSGSQYHPFGSFGLPTPGMTTVTRHAAAPSSTAIPAGSPELPEGVVLPQGWSLLPLQRFDNGAGPFMPHPGQGGGPSQVPLDSMQHFSPPQEATGPFSPPAPEASAAGSSAAQGSGTGPSVFSAQARPSRFTLDQIVQSPASSQPQTRARMHADESGTVAAPSSVVPNWGGSSQLFSNNRGSVVSTPQNAVRGPVAPNGNGEGTSNDQAVHPAEIKSSTPAIPGSVLDEQEDGGPSDKGKGRAVTVEEAEDDDDDDDDVA